MNKVQTLKMPQCFNLQSGGFNMISGVESINNCIGLILTTPLGSVYGKPKLGTNLNQYLYEPNIIVIQDVVRTEVVKSLTECERRIRIDESMIQVSRNMNSNTIIISISYIIKNSGELSTFDLSINI